MKRILILGTLFLAGCASLGQKGDPLPKITFDHVNAYPLYVASYEPVGAVVTSTPVGFIADPGSIVIDYLNSRFEAVGSGGKLVMSIRSVDITHESINSDNSFNAFVGFDKKDHYRVTVVLDINAHGVNNIELQKQSMTVYRDIYISEYVSLVEREELELKAMDNMIDDLDIALREIFEKKMNILGHSNRNRQNTNVSRNSEKTSQE